MLDQHLIGRSNAIKKIHKDVQRLSKLQKHVFIRGDKGTGKTTVATMLHALSSREGKLIVLHPTFSAEEEITNVLTKDPKNVATIVLRDIQDFSFLYQAKVDRFLRGLPQRPFIQIIVTAGKRIDQLKNERKLIDELGTVVHDYEEVVIPPLRERREDIPLLVEYFVKAACESMKLTLTSIDVNVVDFLARRDWVGNVAELKSVVEGAVVTSRDGAFALPENLVNEQAQLENMLKSIRQKRVFSFDTSLSNLEKTLIEKTLETVDHNQTRAAEILNLSEANLRYRLRKFHILPSRKK